MDFTIHYFQWRKGRGGFEKFHGAVVDHEGSSQTRVFGECKQIGNELESLAVLHGKECPKAEVAILFDWETRWAMDVSCGIKRRPAGYPFKADLYSELCISHYQAMATSGLSVDVIPFDADFSGYKVLVTPAAYLLSRDTAQSLVQFAEEGGVWITTCLTGYVDETNRCWQGGFPGPGLREVFGIWNEEVDFLFDEERVEINDRSGSRIGVASDLVEVVHLDGAELIASTGSEFYEGSVAISKNAVGMGYAYYISAKMDDAVLMYLYIHISKSHNLSTLLQSELPEGVVFRRRTSSDGELGFLFNYKRSYQEVQLDDIVLEEFVTGKCHKGSLKLAPYETLVCKLL